MALLDLLGRRWSLRILWELRERPLTSRALRVACGDISPTVLQKRLDELREGKIVERTSEGYALSVVGRDLFDALAPLLAFAKRWPGSPQGTE